MANDIVCTATNPAYGMSNHLFSPYQAAISGPLTPDVKEFHKGMDNCRATAVVWTFE